MNKPLVSVVIGVYNEEDYLKETIDSILNQTLADFEFIIIDDGSEDKTQNILNEYKKIDCRIKLISNRKNLGISKSTNIGIKNAEGKYIAIMDAGDLSNRRRLEKQAKYLEARDDVYILGTQGRWIDGEGKQSESGRCLKVLMEKPSTRLVVQYILQSWQEELFLMS